MKQVSLRIRDLAKEQPENFEVLRAARERYAKDVGVVLSE